MVINMHTFEASVLLPIGICLVLLSISLTLLFHDKTVISAALNETVVWWKGQENTTEKEIEKKLEKSMDMLLLVRTERLDISCETERIDVGFSGVPPLWIKVITIFLPGIKEEKIYVSAEGSKESPAEFLRKSTLLEVWEKR